MKDTKFLINGGNKLSGEVEISGSKNAALPMICASLISHERITITNVPKIKDIFTMLKILDFLEVKSDFRGGVLKIDASSMKNKTLPDDLLCEFRAAILLLSPLLARFSSVKSAYPGGCVLGKRSVFAHLLLFKDLGFDVYADEKFIKIKGNANKNNKIVMSESSVTASENALIIASSFDKEIEIRRLATEPHIQNLCQMLIKMGAEIKNIGSHHVKIKGKKNLKSAKIKVVSDYLEAGTMIIAGIITKSNIKVKNVCEEHLDAFFQKLSELGAKFKIVDDTVETIPVDNFNSIEKVQSAIFPGFPTDLISPFSALLTQAKGNSLIFETLFENRFSYFYEFEKMGAKFTMKSPREIVVHGKTPLSGAFVSSCDIRAGSAVVLASLIADGKTEVSSINYIDRGYSSFDKKLRLLGADIKRITR